MSVRRIGLTCLVLCVLSGLASSFFTPAIAKTLSLPVTSGTGQVSVPEQAQPTLAVNPETGATGEPTPLPSGVTILAHDTFQRPDQSFWGTASDSRAWDSDASTNPAFAIVGDAGQITGNNASENLQGIISVSATNAEILFSGIVNKFDAQGDINLGGVLRWQDAYNWYKVLIDGNHLELLSSLAGKRRILGSQPFQALAGTNYSIRFRAEGGYLFTKAWPSAQNEPPKWTFVVIDTALTRGLGGIHVRLAPGGVIRVTSFLETTDSGTL
jgi:hypothetical protein